MLWYSYASLSLHYDNWSYNNISTLTSSLLHWWVNKKTKYCVFIHELKLSQAFCVCVRSPKKTFVITFLSHAFQCCCCTRYFSPKTSQNEPQWSFMVKAERISTKILAEFLEKTKVGQRLRNIVLGSVRWLFVYSFGVELRQKKNDWKWLYNVFNCSVHRFIVCPGNWHRNFTHLASDNGWKVWV